MLDTVQLERLGANEVFTRKGVLEGWRVQYSQSYIAARCDFVSCISSKFWRNTVVYLSSQRNVERDGILLEDIMINYQKVEGGRLRGIWRVTLLFPSKKRTVRCSRRSVFEVWKTQLRQKLANPEANKWYMSLRDNCHSHCRRGTPP